MITALLLAWPLTACAACAAWAVYRRGYEIPVWLDDAQMAELAGRGAQS